MTNRYHHTPRIAAIIIAITFALTLPLASCDPATPSTKSPTAQSQNTTPKKKQADKSKTHTITFDPFFVKHYLLMDANDTPEKAAKDFRNQHDVYTDAYATPDGTIIAAATEKQLERNIKEYQNARKECEQAFNKDAKDRHNGYRFQISKDGRTFSLWCDNKFNDIEYIATLSTIPKMNGCLYYLQGGTGPWDMQINLYDCHSGQPTRQYLWSQDPNGKGNGWQIHNAQ
ncbi:hypothetical protein OZX72_00090 [Bifidobacterium sp. ESL0769]|uniref:hypothetical protein n=1 Tax=Bifidobacterium sp. ESL0769 TaxID=2983229 RepID=UPI0023F95211|nr:hypothetical protein [Bifidobacterium sp. ESL0769]WEV67455.1 hypothetical protein OZX72_00090 [Bifidobacterium sp. ESL0769]